MKALIGSLVVLLILLFFIYQYDKWGDHNNHHKSHSNHSHDSHGSHGRWDHFHTPQSKPMGLESAEPEYLDRIRDGGITEAEEWQHDEYVTKRRENGDHTMRLPQIDNGVRESNHVGLRRPRKMPWDPNGIMQFSDSQQRDAVQPEFIRLQ